MTKNQIRVAIVDSDSARSDLLCAKIKPFGYVNIVFKSVVELVNTLSTQTYNLIVISDDCFNTYKGSFRRDLEKNNAKQTSFFILKTQSNVTPLNEYYSLGAEGVFDQFIDARTLMSAVRKSTLSKSMQWQVTLNQLPVESISLIANSLDELNQFSRMSFGRGGFSMEFDISLKIGDRVGFSFYFIDHGQSYIVQGIAVVRWSNANDNWAGVEFESATGQGIPVFVQWLEDKGFLEYIPDAVRSA